MRDVLTSPAISSQLSLEPPGWQENMSCKFFTPRCRFDRGRESENNLNNSFISFPIEGGCVLGNGQRT